MGSQKALDVFTKLPIPKDASHKERLDEIGAEYLEKNKLIGKEDSRKLEYMKKSIESLKIVNAKIQKDGGIDGKKLSVLKVNDYVMAVAQANANYSANKMDHAKIHDQTFENLAWNPNFNAGKSDYPNIESPLEGWWDIEKKHSIILDP